MHLFYLQHSLKTKICLEYCSKFLEKLVPLNSFFGVLPSLSDALVVACTCAFNLPWNYCPGKAPSWNSCSIILSTQTILDLLLENSRVKQTWYATPTLLLVGIRGYPTGIYLGSWTNVPVLRNTAQPTHQHGANSTRLLISTQSTCNHQYVAK